MNMEEVRRYLDALDTLSQEIRQSPDFTIIPGKLSRTELRHRFNLHRALINLLHHATIHIMRADAQDYDADSEQRILGALDKASADIRECLARPVPAAVRNLVERSQNLVNQILANVHTIAA